MLCQGKGKSMEKKNIIKKKNWWAVERVRSDGNKGRSIIKNWATGKRKFG